MNFSVTQIKTGPSLWWTFLKSSVLWFIVIQKLQASSFRHSIQTFQPFL